MSSIDPKEDPIGFMFEAAGVPTLSETIAEGRLVDVVTPEELSAYCHVAAGRVSPHCPPGADDLKDLFLCRIITVFSGEESTRYREVNGNPGIIEDDGTVTEVTPERLRHFEWMASILGSAEMANALLTAAPEAIAERARNDVARNVAAAVQ